MNRLVLAQTIYTRLAALEAEMATTDINSARYAEIDVEMKHLRAKLKDVINTVCPVIKD